MLEPEDKQILIDVLAAIFMAADWSKVRGRKPVDVFSHRVIASATRPTLREALSKLCNFLNLQSIPDAALPGLKHLEEKEAAILEELYHSGVYYASLASMRAKELKRPKLFNVGG